jgi:hypothetical protein
VLLSVLDGRPPAHTQKASQAQQELKEAKGKMFGKVGGKENVENKNRRKRGDAKNHNINDDKQRGDDDGNDEQANALCVVFRVFFFRAVLDGKNIFYFIFSKNVSTHFWRRWIFQAQRRHLAERTKGFREPISCLVS